MDRLERFYRIDQLLKERKVVSFADLKAALGISGPTVKRDLEYMRDRFNAPIEYDREANGYRLGKPRSGPRYEIPALTDAVDRAFLAPRSNELDVELRNAERARQQARRYLQTDPTVAIMCLRRGAEAMGKHLYRLLGHEKNGKPARKMMLDELMKPIRDSDVPDVFKLCVQTIQVFGNFANHDQDDQAHHVTEHIAAPILMLYNEAFEMYALWSRYAIKRGSIEKNK
jgi:hypothetical protein